VPALFVAALERFLQETRPAGADSAAWRARLAAESAR
jgi:hypothetical protein